MADYIDREECIEEKYDYQFIELVVEDMSGRPYYSIKYFNKGDGKIHIGYSSYKLEFISEFLREYFMSSVDAVEQKHGHWQVVKECEAYFNECSNCKGRLWEVEPEWIFCPYCACKMDEVTENESKFN